MNPIDLIKSFFEESEEELKEEIQEAEKIKTDAEKRLKALKKKKRKPINKKESRNWIIAIIIIILLLGGFYWLNWYKSTPKPFKYKCKKMNPCKDCPVTASCIMFEDKGDADLVHFTIKNHKDVKGECEAQITIEQKGSILSNKTYKLGVIEANQKKIFKTSSGLPTGTSQISVKPNCEY